MLAIVLGAAAGGGFPQWNSNAAACRRARSDDPAAQPRTQASVAISADGAGWFLLNASPDLRQQIEAQPLLQPRSGLRSSPIKGVILTGGDVDAIAGLLVLRERQPLTVFATAKTHDILDANPIFNVLASDIVKRQRVAISETLTLGGAEAGGRLRVEFFTLPGKVPLYLEAQGETPPIAETDGTVGIEVQDRGTRLLFIPGCAAITPSLATRINGADVVLFDGTLWADDEMIRAGTGPKTGARMGHMSVSGPSGTMAAFEKLEVGRKILIHINNSNPILLDDSPERAAVEAAGWEVAFDGMEIRP